MHETGRSAFEAVSKAVVLVSAACAVATALDLASGAIASIRWYGAAAFAIAFIFAPLNRSLITAILFATCYLVPVIMAAAFDQYIPAFYCIWLAGLLGVMLATGDWRRWSLPAAFRLPVSTWALTVAVSWPLVSLREFDFTTASLGWSPASTSVGVAPYLAAMGVSSAAATTLASLLLIDWLFAAYETADHTAFARGVVQWLAVSAAISVGVGLYQGTVDIQFLNGGVFPDVGRASGTMRDANPYGVLTAMWAPAAIALILALTGQISALVMSAVLLASWCGAWVSGSRNALIACGLGTVGVIWQLAKDLSRRALMTLAGIVVAVATLGGAAFAFVVRHSPTSPIARFGEIARMVAVNKGAGPLDLVQRLWDPYGYGDVAWRMIREFPFFGVGVGTFNLIVFDYAKSSAFIRISFDNAQNWFRHQLAELGIVGSVGWIAWTALFAFLLVTGKPKTPSNRRVINIVRVLPPLIATVSLVGVPAMNAAASITFALFAGWYLLLVDTSAVDTAVSFARRSWAWAAVWAIVVVFAVGTVVSGRSGLRPPHRAERFGWDYSYGFYPPETGGADAGFRRAAKNALAVVDSPDPWLQLTVRADRPDAAQHPIDVAIWRDGTPLLSARLTTMAPLVRYVRVPAGQPRIMFETHADTGLLFKWTPVTAPPPGAVIAQ